MKSKNRPRRKKQAVGLLEVMFLVPPFLALTPNFFAPPDLTVMGLATQELVFAIALVLFVAVCLVQVARAGSLHINREYLLMFIALAAFIFWQAVTLFWAPSPYEGLRLSGVWLGFGVFFGAAILSLNNRSGLWLHYCLTAICVILAGSLLYERALYGYAMAGVFFNHGVSSELLVMLLPAQILSYLCSEKRALALVSFVVSGLSLVTLLIGMRRGAIVAIAVVLVSIGLAVVFKQVRLQSKQRLAIVLAVLVVGAVGVGIRFREEIIFRIQGAVQLQNVQTGKPGTQAVEGGLTTRLRNWITAWEMGKRHAVVGVGNAGYPSLYGSYRRYFVSNPKYADVAVLAGAEDYDEIRSPLVHNEYLQIFVELGIVGITLFIAFWGQVVWRLWQGWRKSRSYWVFGALLGLIAFGISSATSAFSLRYTPEAFLVACVLAVGFAFAKPEPDQIETANPQAHSVALPRFVVIACLAVILVAGAMFSWRMYYVYASQKLQGRAYLRQDPLDFAFFLNDPTSNEGLRFRYERVLALDPHNAGAHLGYGILLYQMKKSEEAIQHIEYALRNGYSRPFTYVLLAFAYEQTNDLAKASQVLDDCAASFPQSIFVRAAYTEMLRKDGKIDRMREEQNAIYAIDEHLAKSWELAMKLKSDEAIAEANRRGLIPPNQLGPRFASMLVGMRAYHYLK